MTFNYTDNQLNNLNQDFAVYSVNKEFSDKVKIEYRVGHSLNDVENYNGFVNGKTNKEINDQWEILSSHKGKTTSLVTIYYSDKEKGVQ